MATPKRTPASWILLSALPLGFACTSTRALQRPLTQEARIDLKKELPDRVDVTVRQGEAATVEPAVELSLSDPMVTWTQAETHQKREVPQEALRSIRWRDHLRGAGQGFLIGGFGLGSILAIAGASSGNDPPCGKGHETFFCFSMTAPEKAAVGLVGGLLVGGLVGGVFGAVVGQEHRIELVP